MEINKAYEKFYLMNADCLGLLLKKTRVRYWSLDHQQGWMIVDAIHDVVVAGDKYHLTFKEAAKFIDDTSSN
jgi:hypothetical protein